jgi:hypothetical protein
MNTQTQDGQTQSAAVRRVVGIAALHRLRQMVDADAAQMSRNRTRARRLLSIALLIVVLGLGFLLRNVIFG